MTNPKEIGRVVLGPNGALLRVRIFYAGRHPELPGAVIHPGGWSGGVETYVDRDQIPAAGTVMVLEADSK